MFQQKKRWFGLLAFLGLFFSQDASAGKANGALQGLLAHIPTQSEAVFWLPRLDRLPKRVDRLLLRLEKHNPMVKQIRAFMEQIKQQTKIDFRDPSSFDRLGLLRQGAGVMTLLNIDGNEWVFFGASLRDANAFSQGLDQLFAQLSGSAEAPRRTTLAIPGGQLVKWLAPNGTDVLATYATAGDRVFLVGQSKKRASAALDGGASTADGAAILKRLLTLPPNQALSQSPSFLQAIQHLSGKEAGAMFIQSSALGAAGQKSPFSWIVVGVQVAKEGVQATIHAEAPQDGDLRRFYRLMGAVSGNPARLVSMLQKDTLAVLRLSMNLPKLLKEALKEAKKDGQSPEVLLSQASQVLGMDIRKEILPIFTGHTFLALLGVDPQIVSAAQRRPALIPSMVEAALLIELNNPAAAARLLENAAQKTQNSPMPMRSLSNGKTPLYQISPQAGVDVYISILGRVLVLALNKPALGKIQLASQQSAQRLFSSFAKAPSALAKNKGMGFLLSVLNLYQAINRLNLPFSVRMMIAAALPFAQGFDISTISILPAPSGLKMDASLTVLP
jgi:hypothetical protein